MASSKKTTKTTAKKTTKKSAPDRRGFFRDLLRISIDKVEQKAQDLERKISHAVERSMPENEADLPYFDPEDDVRYLRPPGTLGQADLERSCCQSGECAKACPADAIQLDPEKRIAGGFPYIIAAESPCVMCDDLACTHVCPTGSILPLSEKDEISMGYVDFDGALCLRSEDGDCRLCVDQCPVGEDAISIDPDDSLIVLNGECTGCGVCEKACPTSPKAIWVEPYEYVN